MKTTLLIALMACTSICLGQTDKSLARVSKSSGKLVFYFNDPIEKYTTSFTFKNEIPGYNCASSEQVINASLKNAMLEAGVQERKFDAIVLAHGERDMAILFEKTEGDVSIARVKKTNGKYVFIECEPVTEYKMVNKYKVGMYMITGGCLTKEAAIDKLLKKSFKAEKKGQEFDGVTFGSTTYDLSIEFD